MEIHWTQEALLQLLEIESFISKDSPDRAATFVAQILEYAGSSLVDHPRIGRIVPEISNQVIRELIFKGYRIVYKLYPDRIEILTVFEGHRLLKIDTLP